MSTHVTVESHQGFMPSVAEDVTEALSGVLGLSRYVKSVSCGPRDRAVCLDEKARETT